MGTGNAAAAPPAPSRRRWRGYAVLAIATVLLAAFAGLVANGVIDLAPERHSDGHGPLGSLGGSGTAFYVTAGESTWTVGIRLCLASGGLPAVLDGSVLPASQVQGGMRFLGAYVREGVPAQGFMTLGSIAGFPPAYPYDRLHAEKGFAVTTRCADAALGDAAPFTELDIGLAEIPGAPGGGWLGVDVGYNSGWRHHVVTLNYHYFACDAGAPARYCPRLATPSPAG